MKIVDRLDIINITPLDIGESTIKYTGNMDNNKVVLRLYNDNYYGDRLNREISALNTLRYTDINIPEILGIDLDERIIVLEWIEGEVMNNYYKKELQEILGSIQKVSHDNRTNFFDKIRLHTSKIEENNQLFDEYMNLYKFIWDYVDLSWYDPKENVLIHGDFHPGNIIISKTGLSVIDWEYSSFGPKIFDTCYLQKYIDVNSNKCTHDVKMIIDLMDTHFNISFSKNKERTIKIIEKYMQDI